MTKAEQEKQKKIAFLQSLTSGIPTKESELTKKLISVNESKFGGKDNVISESNRNEYYEDTTQLKSAIEVKEQINNTPPSQVPVNAITALIKGDKNKAKQIVEEEDREIPQEKFDTKKLLQEKVATKSKQIINNNPTNKPNQSLSSFVNKVENTIQNKNLGVDKTELREMIKEVVYEILAEVYEVEEKNRMLKENIHIRIGNTLFSGVLKPITKINKK